MTDAPEAIVTLSAELRDGSWTIYAIPDGPHTDADRMELGTGRGSSADGSRKASGIMFPLSMLERFRGR